MNIKLLKELYKQAETECGWSEEKFAELIVRECLYIADREHKLALESEWDNDDTATSIKDSIKKHFGVK
jgi:hypothetical protein